MNQNHRKTVLLVLLALCMVLGTACGPKQPDAVLIAGYELSNNDGRNAETYPYLVRTPHAVWYLAAADIELLGEEAFYAGLERTLSNQEADFSDVYSALDGFLKEEIAPIDVYTDFSGRSERAKWGYIGAFYSEVLDAIYLYGDWDNADRALLHEYSHYLTHKCCTFGIDEMFWSESIAEYLSVFACRNRMGRSVPADPETAARGFTDEDGTVDPKKVYCANAVLLRSEAAIGAQYSAVSQSPITLTEELLKHPMMTTVSYYEAACFFDWLVWHYGKELVFSHLTAEQRDMKDIYGEDFETLFFAWAEDNNALCAEYGLDLSPASP